jgi:aminoglycoside 6-adenylyltransferase
VGGLETPDATAGQDIIERVVEWARKHEQIRVAILTGSRAGGAQIDEFSDYDVALYGYNFEPFLHSNTWIREIGDYWVYQKERTEEDEFEVPSRLIVLEGGDRVDLTFHPLLMLRRYLERGLPDGLDGGYRVILDKDGITPNLPAPSNNAFKVGRPTRDVFLQTVHDFWFEVLGLAKYLKRNDLYFAKTIQLRYVQDLVFRTIVWHTQAGHDWDRATHPLGKRMDSWADDDIKRELPKLFSGYDLEESWKSLFAVAEFYGRLGRGVAASLGYPYPAKVEENVMKYVTGLWER